MNPPPALGRLPGQQRRHVTEGHPQRVKHAAPDHTGAALASEAQGASAVPLPRIPTTAGLRVRFPALARMDTTNTTNPTNETTKPKTRPASEHLFELEYQLRVAARGYAQSESPRTRTALRAAAMEYAAFAVDVDESLGDQDV